MKSVSELIEIQDLLQRLRALLQARRQASATSDPQLSVQLARTDVVLSRVAAGEHPACEVCGEHIAVGELRRSPLAAICQRCALDAAQHVMDGIGDPPARQPPSP